MKDLRHMPLEVIFTFPAPNYVDPETRGDALVIVNGIFISLVTVAVFLRLYTRIFVKRWFGSDDIFIIFAFITTVALTVTVVLADKQYYWDRHVWDIPLDSIRPVLIIAYIAKLIFVWASTFTRLSLLFFYYRLVQDSGISWFRWLIHASVVFNIVLCIVFSCVGIFLCHPVRGYWEFPSPADVTCMNEGPATLGIGIVNIFADLLVTLLPVPVIIRLQMPLSRRIGVILLLGLGGIVIIAGTVRTYYIWKGLMDSYDETWFTYPLWICAAVEIDLGVICACAPAIRPLTSKLFASTISSFSEKLSALRSSRRDDANKNPTSKSYLKFSNSGDAKAGLSHSSKDSKASSASPGTSIDKNPHITSTSTTTAAEECYPGTKTTTFARDVDEEAADDRDSLTSPNSAPRFPFPRTTPSTEHLNSARSSSPPGPDPLDADSPPPSAPGWSSLQITRRESFELSSLDYADAAAGAQGYAYGGGNGYGYNGYNPYGYGHGLDTIPGGPGSPLEMHLYGGPGPGIVDDPASATGNTTGTAGHGNGNGGAGYATAAGDVPLELDPRQRAGSPFGSCATVRGRCPNADREEAERERERRGRGRGRGVGSLKGLGGWGFV